MAEKIVDTRGLSCPQPLLMMRKALKAESGPITVMVDSPASIETIIEALSRQKRKVEIESKASETIFRIGPG